MALATPSSIVPAIAALSVLYIVSVAIYRLYLGPLAKFPGPRLAALTIWYERYYDVFLPGQYTFKIKELHKQYGPIIRINPTNIHVSDLSFVDTIYASRDRDGIFEGGLMVEESMAGVTEYHHHKRRREAAGPHFTQRSVEKLEPLLQDKTSQLAAILEKHLATGEPVNLSDAYFAYTNDVVRSFCFGDDNGLLRDMDSANVQRNNLMRLLKGVQVAKHFGWLRDLVSFVLPDFIGKRLVPPGILDILQFRAGIGEKIKVILADGGGEKAAQASSVFYELKGSPKLADAEKTLSLFQDEATIFIMAGTESPAKTLQIAQFYILKHPHVLLRLRQELADLARPFSMRDVQAVPYLGAVIHEANRLSFGLTGRTIRAAPYPLQYKDYTIPARTAISQTTFGIHTDEELFPDPWTFDPERWLGEDGKRRNKYNLAFGKGVRVCLGMNLANAEMHLAIATAAMYDMELFETEETDVKFQYDFQISHARPDSKGVRAVVKSRM